MAAGEGVHLERQGQPHHGIRQRFADPRGMRQQQIALQELELGGGDAGLRQQPEASVDAVGGVAGGDDVVHQHVRGEDGRPGGRTQGEFRRVLVNASQLAQRQRAGRDRRRAAHQVRPSMGRFKPCSRAHSMAAG